MSETWDEYTLRLRQQLSRLSKDLAELEAKGNQEMAEEIRALMGHINRVLDSEKRPKA